MVAILTLEASPMTPADLAAVARMIAPVDTIREDRGRITVRFQDGGSLDLPSGDRTSGIVHGGALNLQRVDAVEVRPGTMRVTVVDRRFTAEKRAGDYVRLPNGNKPGDQVVRVDRFLMPRVVSSERKSGAITPEEQAEERARRAVGIPRPAP